MKYNFKPYLQPVFIETGTAVGEGVSAALKAGFKTILSVELNPEAYMVAYKRFGRRKRRVKLYLGDSRAFLRNTLPFIKERCLFWLDAHYCGEGSAGEPFTSPLMEELQIIGKHPIRNHTIMIDDIRLIRNKEGEWKNFPYCTCDIEEFLHTTNPNYVIKYEAGPDGEDDILIAYVP